MRYSFTSRDFNAGDNIKEKTMQKIGRLERILPENCEVFVTFSTIKINNKVEVTIPLKGRTLRAEVTDVDMLNAVDKVVDALERQMKKYKGQLNNKARRDSSFIEEYNNVFSSHAEDSKDSDEQKVLIKKTKKFAFKPMDVEEAVMNMELLGHNFFVFRNSRTEEINVVYKRHDSTYGIIEPEV
ncbi:ribosome hibernation-promoting factor, HPF/YfiA family [Anaeropeptidivorans aminofermentans]|uniref:ribosome hibernation-promoting factor, HPF/YfiA family n=1 Tax=Anaeropeptidivorans aminofermentans TaxID=2934315 RepID=UPI00202442AD|nr:ribosome-associated translation inhibitor RaiA [Anaeropeptidivorans aminofermentans]